MELQSEIHSSQEQAFGGGVKSCIMSLTEFLFLYYKEEGSLDFGHLGATINCWGFDFESKVTIDFNQLIVFYAVARSKLT